MKVIPISAALVTTLWLAAPAAQAAPCMVVTLTGTQSGPPLYDGRAGAGTLVGFGDDSNNCGAVKLQFDTGRGTNQRLSQLRVNTAQLNAIFFTHMHSDHSEGLADILQHRWNYASAGPKVDVVCSNDAKSPLGHTMSCTNFVKHIGDFLIQSGEIAQRRVENKERLAGGPADIANASYSTPYLKSKDRMAFTGSFGDKSWSRNSII